MALDFYSVNVIAKDIQGGDPREVKKYGMEGVSDYTEVEVATVLDEPLKLDVVDSFPCPVCESEMDLHQLQVTDALPVRCHVCEYVTLFRLVKI